MRYAKISVFFLTYLSMYLWSQTKNGLNSFVTKEYCPLGNYAVILISTYNLNACYTFRVEETEETGQVVLVYWAMKKRNRKEEATNWYEKLVLPTKIHVFTFHTTVTTVLATVRTCSHTRNISL